MRFRVKKKKSTCHAVDFAIPGMPRVKILERWTNA